MGPRTKTFSIWHLTLTYQTFLKWILPSMYANILHPLYNKMMPLKIICCFLLKTYREGLSKLKPKYTST
jgi:hypothetical protein